MGDARQFQAELDRFIGKVETVDLVDLQKRIVGETLTQCVQRTPVGNPSRWKFKAPKGYVGGQARKNWQVTIGTPSRSIVAGTDASGQSALTAGYTVLGGLRKPERMWISNPLPYMSALEDGWSKQAPVGIVREAIAAVTAKYGRVR